MRRVFVTNLALVLVLNLLVKPFYILGIDAGVQVHQMVVDRRRDLAGPLIGPRRTIVGVGPDGNTAALSPQGWR